MKSQDGEVLYVGKASSLRKRVSSYFLKNVPLKTGLLITNVADIDYIECDSEAQALVLEAALIKEKKPKYNISLRDDKSYPFVEITDEDFPRIFVTRKKTNKKSFYFGPYPDVGTLRSVLNMLRRIFPYCSCKCFKNTECLYSHIKLCPAPCSGKISKALYKENIEGIVKVLKGQRHELTGFLRAKMDKLSEEKNYEAAAAVRDKMVALENLYRGKSLTHELISLKESLGLSQLPLRIEAIDISSLSGTNATGSVVVFKNAAPDKDSYRRYRYKRGFSTDDYAMMAEVVRRRYKGCWMKIKICRSLL
jgi:excinuclease ABC subunit C